MLIDSKSARSMMEFNKTGFYESQKKNADLNIFETIDTPSIANQTETKQTISKALATGFFNRAYPQAKKKRAPKPLTESEHIANAKKLTKFVSDINVIYVSYVKSGGKSGSADRLREEAAEILTTLEDEIATMFSNRSNAESLANEIEEGLKRKAV